MPYPAKAVANYLFDLAHQGHKLIDPMQMQKLVYFAHGWHLALRNDPLILEHIEAWLYGPVVPTLYHEFKKWGGNPIREHAKEVRLDLDPVTGEPTLLEIVIPSLDHDPDTARRDATKGLIARVWEIYGHLTALQLSALTHEPGSPWDLTRQQNPDRRGTDIPDALIKTYFLAKAKANESARVART